MATDVKGIPKIRILQEGMDAPVQAFWCVGIVERGDFQDALREQYDVEVHDGTRIVHRTWEGHNVGGNRTLVTVIHHNGEDWASTP